MNTVEQYKDLFRSAFEESQGWTGWFFSEVFRPEYLRVLPDVSANGRVVSALLSMPYKMNYSGVVLPVDYICGVATAPQARGKGRMTELMRMTLDGAQRSGSVLSVLIPATRRLYFFYDSFGFSTVFYADEERYTSVHDFNGHTDSIVEKDPDFDTFRRLERQAGASVLHSSDDFRHVLADIAMDGGRVAAVGDSLTGDAAMAFAVGRSDGTVLVKTLLAESEKAADAVLALLRQYFGERPFLVMRPPVSGMRARMRTRGMLRINDVERLLGALAAVYPSLKTCIRVSDPLIVANNGCFNVSDGFCHRTDRPVKRVPDYDIDVGILARLVFGSPALSQVTGIPAVRPWMSLMLD